MYNIHICVRVQAEALKEQSSSRVRLNVTIHAPVVVLPLSASSQSALVANLGSLTVKNKFLLASEVVKETGSPPPNSDGFLSPKGVPAIVDKMSIILDSIQLGRFVKLCLIILLNASHSLQS